MSASAAEALTKSLARGRLRRSTVMAAPWPPALPVFRAGMTA